ncbi:MAG: lipid A biosynthesis lauroyl acyltransferase [Roseitalea sp.]|jgi:KDO2-lipid IV(A) lauroyltransferase|nr:lipid A biosynthesis lauroyl acyltransferase [Roseitalea sp.]MBO6721325.1 lipid A biosynthesis lauroyl acyltransferase [Roseitalea sp.]MBO6742190.1 lipid A biosynthesis lauroyl acyltransferase [Roseitalea sp.]
MTPAQTRLLKLTQKVKRARYWIEAHLTFAVLAALNLLPADAAINTLAALAARLGPLLPRQKVVLNNLARAMPELSNEEHRAIARRMWGNMGRQVAEYVVLDKLFDFDPETDADSRIEVRGKDIFLRIHAAGKPVIFFTGHTGNFELLPICAATFDLEVTALFRPPNNPYVAKRVLAARTTTMGQLVPSKTGAAAGLARALSDGKSVGVLVDQKFHRGRLGTFFGRPVRTNPLLPKLVRQFGCDVHPARCVRLPGNRFRLELEEAIALPRDGEGRIDVDASTQMLNDVVERWVREYPDQWMWMHRRWDPKTLVDPRAQD